MHITKLGGLSGEQHIIRRPIISSEKKQLLKLASLRSPDLCDKEIQLVNDRHFVNHKRNSLVPVVGTRRGEPHHLCIQTVVFLCLSLQFCSCGHPLLTTPLWKCSFSIEEFLKNHCYTCHKFAKETPVNQGWNSL